MADAEPKKPAYLTTNDLIDRWKISRTTIYREVERGQLKQTRIAGSVRFAMAEVERYERTRTH